MRSACATLLLAAGLGTASARAADVPFTWEGTLTLTTEAAPASADYSDGSIDFTLYHPVCPLVQTCVSTAAPPIEVPVLVEGIVDTEALLVRDVQIGLALDPPLTVEPFTVTTPNLGPVIVLVDPPGFPPPMNVQIYEAFFTSIDVLEAFATIDPAPDDFPINPVSLTASTEIGSAALSIQLGLAPEGVPLVPLMRDAAAPIYLQLEFAQPSAALLSLKIISTAVVMFGGEFEGYEPAVLDYFRAQDPDLPIYWANEAIDLPGLGTFFWSPSSASTRLRSAVAVPEASGHSIALAALTLLAASKRA